MSEDEFLARARAHGPWVPAAFRVVVLEADTRWSIRDFPSRGDACAYADDAASESDDAWPIAKVFDERGALVHEGKSFAGGPR